MPHAKWRLYLRMEEEGCKVTNSEILAQNVTSHMEHTSSQLRGSSRTTCQGYSSHRIEEHKWRYYSKIKKTAWRAGKDVTCVRAQRSTRFKKSQWLSAWSWKRRSIKEWGALTWLSELGGGLVFFLLPVTNGVALWLCNYVVLNVKGTEGRGHTTVAALSWARDASFLEMMLVPLPPRPSCSKTWTYHQTIYHVATSIWNSTIHLANFNVPGYCI